MIDHRKMRETNKITFQKPLGNKNPFSTLTVWLAESFVISCIRKSNHRNAVLTISCLRGNQMLQFYFTFSFCQSGKYCQSPQWPSSHHRNTAYGCSLSGQTPRYGQSVPLPFRGVQGFWCYPKQQAGEGRLSPAQLRCFPAKCFLTGAFSWWCRIKISALKSRFRYQNPPYGSKSLIFI